MINKTITWSFVTVLSWGSLSAQNFDEAFNRGMERLFTGHYDQAIENFQQALTAKAKDSSACYQMARAYAEKGDIDQAISNLHTAIDEDQEDYKVIHYSYLLQDTFFLSLHQTEIWKNLITDFEKKVGGTRPDLFRELMDIGNKDQEYRRQLMKLVKAGQNNSSAYSTLERLMINTDSINLIRIEQIMDQYGYPGKDLVGDASKIAWIVIQHADVAVQKKYLPVLEKAAGQGDIGQDALATTVDRVRVREGKKQLYGTQYKKNEVTGEFEFNSIEDVENVNLRRAEVGLRPIEEDARRYGIKWQ